MTNLKAIGVLLLLIGTSLSAPEDSNQELLNNFFGGNQAPDEPDEPAEPTEPDAEPAEFVEEDNTLPVDDAAENDPLTEE